VTVELRLRFPDPGHVALALDGRSSTRPHEFSANITPNDREDIRWYLETYAGQYTTEADDEEARRIEAKLPAWGAELFKAVFGESAAGRAFSRFVDSKDQERLLTISSGHPAILSLPWELLRIPGGDYLARQVPVVSIRRRAVKVPRRRVPALRVGSHLRMLFVTSRPSDAAFIDPRSESMAVLDAVRQGAQGRIDVEFLRPATFRNLAERLSDKSVPGVDIVHFDGHGAFDADGRFADRTANTGYLLFESDAGLKQPVSPALWQAQLGDCGVSLVVLSACQSATLAADGDAGAEPIGSVAYGLAARCVPAVLAMTHSLLVDTARQLFGDFYRSLSEGNRIGAALDDARQCLLRDQRKHEVHRSGSRVRLSVQDWFLPALYQAGADRPLLEAGDGISAARSSRAQALPTVETRTFFGRKRELWNIERWFVTRARSITISGFAGQGKTALAVEAGRWLQRTGMFHHVAFVDYSGFRGTDAAGHALEALAGVLGISLPGPDAATVALARVPTLVILDHLDHLSPTSIEDLLGIATTWSSGGPSRLLITTRTPARVPRRNVQDRTLTLSGLEPEDALRFLRSLTSRFLASNNPVVDDSAALKQLASIGFHPLLIRLLTTANGTPGLTGTGQPLESLLAEGGDEDRSLLASIRLFLEQLDSGGRAHVARLGVFQGGAMEDVLLLVTGLGRLVNPELLRAKRMLAAIESRDVRTMAAIAFQRDVTEDDELPPEMVQRLLALDESSLEPLRREIRRDAVEQRPPSALADGVNESTWPRLKADLMDAALIEADSLDAEGVPVPYLRFHPALAPLLWPQLTEADRIALQSTHSRWYYDLSRGLRGDDFQHPHKMRAAVRRELPNFRHALESAFEANVEHAANFADNVIHFLKLLGLDREADAWLERAAPLAERRAELLLESGDAAAAAAAYAAILARVGDAPSVQRGWTMRELGRCFHKLGRLDEAMRQFQAAVALGEGLSEREGVDALTGALQTDLGSVLTDMGRLQEARTTYEAASRLKTQAGDVRGVAIVAGQLGNLAFRQNDLPTADRHYREAIQAFRRLGEPGVEANYRHQLGRLSHQAGQWDEAEQHYRESAQLAESCGNAVETIRNWSQLAGLSRAQQKFEAAESWYRKTLHARRNGSDPAGLARTLNDLALCLLEHRPNSLAEARQLAEEALAIKQTLEPLAGQIWQTNAVLADIADAEHDAVRARHHRQQARRAYRDFAGPNELRPYAGFINVVALMATVPSQRFAIPQLLKAMELRGMNALIPLIGRIVEGERDVDVLCDALDFRDSLIVEVVLARIGGHGRP